VGGGGEWFNVDRCPFIALIPAKSAD